MDKIIIYNPKRKRKVKLLSYSCDICGKVLCKDNETLPSFRCSMYLSDEIYEHFCDKHTLLIDHFIKNLKEAFKNTNDL